MHRNLGAIVLAQGTLFRVWAPACESLSVELEGRTSLFALRKLADGFFEGELQGVPAGSSYRYVLPSGHRRPDPASRFQPAGVHGPSQIIDSDSFQWRDHDWRGIAKQSLVIYELHIGTFTQVGTYLAAIDRLAELRELGVTAVELMPLAESAGRWNWGYDGVNFFAPRHTYGTPDDLRRFVDAAHNHGLAVMIDVVYNHFGPEGNYLRDFGGYISDKHFTAWGDAPNFDSSDPLEARYVRDFFVANATYWIDEFHLDGLRIDAIHCMADSSTKHIVFQLAEAIAGMRNRLGRHLHLIAESNVYDPELLSASKFGGHSYDAEWCDDFLHSVFAVLRPGEHMSNREYSAADLNPTLKRGFVYQGSVTEARRRIDMPPNPEEVADLESLVFSIQNHDFIGNHPLGQRLHQLTSPDAHRAAAALLLLYPAIPMLFMGEEFACDNPFHFFVDYGDSQLREAVERGRHAEYPQHDWTYGATPLSANAFETSKIGPASAGDQGTRDWYKSLIAMRQRWKSLGWLHSRHLNVDWHANLGYALLEYEKGQERAFVLVRLNREHTSPPELRTQIRGHIELSQNVAASEDADVFRLTANSVLAGTGTIEVHTQLSEPAK